MLTNATITVYNKFYDTVAKADKWYRTVIKNVNWNASKGINIMSSGLSTADAVIIQVPIYTADFGGKEYKEAKQWAQTPNVDMPNFFTFAPGDIVVKNEVDFDINITGGQAALEKAYDYVYKIKTVDPVEQGSISLQHWRLGAG